MPSAKNQPGHANLPIPARHHRNTPRVKVVLHGTESKPGADGRHGLVGAQPQGGELARVNGDALLADGCEAWVRIVAARSDCELCLQPADDLEGHGDLDGVLWGDEALRR